MLLLGAGASAGSHDSKGNTMPLGDDLARELAALMGWPYTGEALSKVYSAVNVVDATRLHAYLRTRLTNTKPSPALLTILSFPWSRIFTLNIDDCAETALRSGRSQKLEIFFRNSPLEESDPIFERVQLVKLNGSADRPEDGFIFSPQEYGEGSNRLPIWYRELGQNHSSYTFIFIGSKLDEPLFQHAISEMRSTVKRAPLRGYVITPTASEIDKHHLTSLNLTHIAGTIGDFAKWLDQEMPKRPAPWDLAIGRRPELRNISKSLNEPQKRALNSVTLVSTDSLPHSIKTTDTGAIRDFYRGYKPHWIDIIDGVPGELSFINDFLQYVEANHSGGKCILLVGPAGSGKTTALMMTALRLSQKSDAPVYFLREAVSDIKDIIISLEQINTSTFYLFIDKIDSMHNEISEILQSAHARHACIVASERLNIWNRRVKNVVEPILAKTFTAETIRRADANLILDKLEKFGPWTRLQPLSRDQRVKEIYAKADRQLLIGLMEATTGLGFIKIIENDFRNLGDDRHKKFLIIVGFASIHRSTLSSSIVGSALLNLGISEDVNVMSQETAGAVITGTNKFTARHPVYVESYLKK